MGIARLGPRYLPFADVASPEMPLSKWLRLSLFQVSVGMALVLLVGTLNRVMIVELTVPASVVGIMISLPLVFAPFRALIGFRSDTYRSAIGWRRAPFIFRGSMLQFGGFAVMPFALLVLAGWGHAADAPQWIGITGAAIAFLLVGAGAHMVQTVGLALATDLAKPEDQPKVVGLMYVMLLVGMALSALIFGALLSDFSPGRLIRVVQGAAVLTLVINIIAMWKMEPRGHRPPSDGGADPQFMVAWRAFLQQTQPTRRLFVIGLGTMGFAMADVLLEPYGGQVLQLSVAETTRLTAAFAVGGLIGLVGASRMLSRGGEPLLLAGGGILVGIPAFMLVMLASLGQSLLLFGVGTMLMGLGAGLFGHGTLTATMRLAPREQVGLALGAWGAVQATAAGVAISLGSILRDVIQHLPMAKLAGTGTPYLAVYCLEIVLLLFALLVLAPLLPQRAATAAR
ncbi:MAG: PucC family protein [Pseudomonadota bacterium]